MSTTEELPTKTPAQVIEDILAKLSSGGGGKRAAYTMIVGAGFSCGVVPMTKDLMHEWIGDFYYPFDTTGAERTPRQRRKLSRDYWKEFNAAAIRNNLPAVELDQNGLPSKPSVAYQSLFTYEAANALFAPLPGSRPMTYLEKLQQRQAERFKQQPPDTPRTAAFREWLKRKHSARSIAIGLLLEKRLRKGEKFVRDFLQSVLDPGGYESERGGYCTTGRNSLNAAHFFLGSLIELQQSGVLYNLRPFCRTIFTTNFDTLLQEVLQLVNVLYSLSDRPERGLDPSDFPEDDPAVHLVYTHGTILRHNAASTTPELARLSEKNAEVLRTYIQSRDVLVFGYGGWDDSLMSALNKCDPRRHQIYWCNVYSADEVNNPYESRLAEPVQNLIKKYDRRAFYVPLGSEGAGGFMARLYHALSPDRAIPRLLCDPVDKSLYRLLRVNLDLTLSVTDREPAIAFALPLPRLERSMDQIRGSACIILRAARSSFQCTQKESRRGLAEARALAQLEEGFALAWAGKNDAAIKAWTRLIRSKKRRFEAAEAVNYVGILHTRLGRYDSAIRAFNRALETDGSGPYGRVEVLTNRGAVHYHRQQWDLAAKDFSEAIHIWEGYRARAPVELGERIDLCTRALIYRGLAYQMKGEVARAQEDFNRALALKHIPADCIPLIPQPPGKGAVPDEKGVVTKTTQGASQSVNSPL